MEYLAQLRGSDELRVHEEFVKQRLEVLKLREQQAIDEKNKLQQRLDGLNAASNSTEVEKLEGRVKEANREIQSIADSSRELSFNLELKRAQVKSEETVSVNRSRDSRVLLVLGWIVGIIGAILAVTGFRLWYKRLQWFQDRAVVKEAEGTKEAEDTKPTEDILAADAANKQIEQSQSNQPAPVKLPEPIK